MSLRSWPGLPGAGKAATISREHSRASGIAREEQEHASAAGARQGGRRRSLAAHSATLVEQVAATVHDPLGRRVITLSSNTLTNNPMSAERYCERFGALKNVALRTVLAHAQDQRRPDADLDVTRDLLSGYVLAQRIKPPSQAFWSSSDQWLDVVFQGVAPPPLT